MLKTTITPAKLNDLRQVLADEGNDLYDFVGAPTKLIFATICPVTATRIDYGHLVEGLGYVSTNGIAIMLIRGLVELAVELKFPQITAPLPMSEDFGNSWNTPEPEAPRYVPPVAPLTVDPHSATWPELAPLPIDYTSGSLSLENFGPGFEAEPIELEPYALEPEPEPVAKVEPAPPGLVQVPSGKYAPGHSGRFRSKTYFVPKGAKVNVMDLPSGTILKYEQDEPATEFDRTPVPNDFDIRSVPTMDRDLIRYEGEADLVGPAVVRKFAGEIRFDQPELDLSQIPAQDRPLFEGYKPGTLIFRNASDVRNYEAAHGDPELMASLAEADDEELGKEQITTIKRQDGVGMLRTSKGTKKV